MIFLKFPKIVRADIEVFEHESDDVFHIESRLCEVIMITKKFFQEGETAKETFVVICHDSEGNIYEKFLNEVQLVESDGTLIDQNNFKQNNYGDTNFGTGQGAVEKSRRRKKNRKRTVPSANRENIPEKRDRDLDRDGNTGQTNATENR